MGHPDGTGWTRVTVELWETWNTAEPETNSPTGWQQSPGMGLEQREGRPLETSAEAFVENFGEVEL